MMQTTIQYMRRTAAGGLAATVLLFTACASIPAPTEQLAVTQASITQAESSEALRYAPVELRTAQEKLNRARAAMDDEEYVTAKRLAEQAEVDARLAAAKARAFKSQQAANELQQGVDTLRQELRR